MESNWKKCIDSQSPPESLNKKSIVFAIKKLSPGGGAEKQILLHYKSLQEMGYDVAIVSKVVDWDFVRSHISDARVITPKEFFLNHRAAILITYLMWDHCFGFLLSFFSIKWIPFERIHPKYYLRFPLDQPALRTLKYWFINFILKKKSYKIFVQTESAKKSRSELGVYPGKICVIPNSYPLPPAESIVANRQTWHVAAIGRLVDFKDFKLAFEVIKYANELSSRPVILDLVGDGPLAQELKEYSRKLGLDDRIQFHGFAKNPWKIAQGADLFVITSHIEGMPNTLGEAMAHGLPCVACNFPGGASELLGESIEIHRGQVVDSRDPRVIASKVVEILSNNNLRDELGQANKSRIASRFSREATMQRFHDALQSNSI
jgi:glycosyltransferase involved in cell wall biosynthesis